MLGERVHAAQLLRHAFKLYALKLLGLGRFRHRHMDDLQHAFFRAAEAVAADDFIGISELAGAEHARRAPAVEFREYVHISN